MFIECIQDGARGVSHTRKNQLELRRFFNSQDVLDIIEKVLTLLGISNFHTTWTMRGNAISPLLDEAWYVAYFKYHGDINIFIEHACMVSMMFVR